MEKLQTAHDKARKTRQNSSVVIKRPSSDSERPTQSLDAERLWQNLTEINVGKETLEQHRLVTQVANSKATAFDILRTKVLLQMRQNGWKRLAITSPMPNSGKTTMSCNLALGLARQTDLRSMVFDLDLRGPSVHEFLDHTPQNGIGDVLAGTVDFADQAVRIGENVSFSMANAAEQDPAKVLLAEETSNVIDQIERDYKPDIIIFDLPSLLVNDDTQAFLKNVDCALIVVRANKTNYNQFDVAEREIPEQTNVLGAVLNAYQYSGKSRSDG